FQTLVELAASAVLSTHLTLQEMSLLVAINAATKIQKVATDGHSGRPTGLLLY
ncbi:hypothetical protein HAX54_017685, partial [Datura stramonium]|nr:hypothetical protein [Datura stramonium]